MYSSNLGSNALSYLLTLEISAFDLNLSTFISLTIGITFKLLMVGDWVNIIF